MGGGGLGAGGEMGGAEGGKAWHPTMSGWYFAAVPEYVYVILPTLSPRRADVKAKSSLPDAVAVGTHWDEDSKPSTAPGVTSMLSGSCTDTRSPINQSLMTNSSRPSTSREADRADAQPLKVAATGGVPPHDRQALHMHMWQMAFWHSGEHSSYTKSVGVVERQLARPNFCETQSSHPSHCEDAQFLAQSQWHQDEHALPPACALRAPSSSTIHCHGAQCRMGEEAAHSSRSCDTAAGAQKM